MRQLTTFLIFAGVLAAPAFGSAVTPTVFIADSQNNRVRMINGSGTISTVAGNGVGMFGGDGGPATSASLKNPTGVAVFGNLLYIADNQNNRIRVVNLTTGIITTFAGTGAAGSGGDNGPATSAQLNGPYGVAVDGTGNVYIADTNNNRIRAVSTGFIVPVAGNGTVGNGGDGGAATSAQLYHPMGVAVDNLGNIYIADTDNQKVRKVNAGGTISTVAGTGSVGYSCTAGGTATSVGLHNPTGVANYNPSPGAFAIADTGNQCVRDVQSGSIVSTIGNGIASFGGDGGPAASAELNYPTGVAVDQTTGNVYIADTVNNRIRLVNSASIITTVAGTGVPGFSGDGGPAQGAQLYNPTGVAVIPVGP